MTVMDVCSGEYCDAICSSPQVEFELFSFFFPNCGYMQCFLSLVEIVRVSGWVVLYVEERALYGPGCMVIAGF